MACDTDRIAESCRSDGPKRTCITVISTLLNLMTEVTIRAFGAAGCLFSRDGRPNGQTVHPQDAFTRERTCGAPLAAMHTGLTLSVCKRRDAVRLAQSEPARPAGAAFGVLSGATVS